MSGGEDRASSSSSSSCSSIEPQRIEGHSSAWMTTSPTTCTQIFDQLWFCLSPVYQFREYYVQGEFDTCEAKASALYMCLADKVHKDPDIQSKLQQTLRKTQHFSAGVLSEKAEAVLGKDKASQQDKGPIWELKEKPGWY